MNLQNKTAIITGGSKGIGRGIAEAFASEGMNVVISARNENEVTKAAREISERGKGKCVGVVCDVREHEQVKQMVASAIENFKTLDVVINNAGVGKFAKVEDMSPGDFRLIIETNVIGVYHVCHESIPHLKKQGGYIINISSLAGTNAHPKMAAYNASKFGLNGFSEALMQELRDDNIKVSYIMPGSVNTYFNDDEPSDDNAWQLQPEDIARVCVDLLHHDERSLPSRVEIRPSKPQKK
ncbi:MAG: SDR family oxidoreductase [Pyrinomonadaceae bacterium MAG19_C2-C3]|nr:SDR family oxidoreductase [Pyrinomonadaceae bacterium MAG19_C2-C3]